MVLPVSMDGCLLYQQYSLILCNMHVTFQGKGTASPFFGRGNRGSKWSSALPKLWDRLGIQTQICENQDLPMIQKRKGAGGVLGWTGTQKKGDVNLKFAKEKSRQQEALQVPYLSSPQARVKVRQQQNAVILPSHCQQFKCLLITK